MNNSKKIVPILSLYEPNLTSPDTAMASGRSSYRYQGKQLQLSHSSTASIYKTPSLAYMTPYSTGANTTPSIRSSITDLVKFNKMSPHRAEEEGKEESVSKFFLSIQFFLILVICGIVILSSVVLSSTWMGALMPSIWGLSNTVKDYQVSVVVGNIKETIQEVLIVSSAAKSQLVHSLNYSDKSWIEKHMYTLYKSELEFHKDLMITTYIGDDLGTCYGIITWNSSTVALVYTNLNDQQLFFCDDVATYDYCKHNSKPDVNLGKFDMSQLVETANLFAGSPAFTLSYADHTMPQYVFISLINSWKRAQPVNGSNFDYYFGYDISVGTLTTHIENILDTSYGARFAIVETATNYVIAMDQTKNFLTWNANEYVRLSIHTVEDTQMKYVFSQISGDYSSMKTVKCNSQVYLSKGGYFIALHRYCTGNNIDWMIVYTVPEWSFTGSFIVGLLSALTGTVLIMIVSAVVGIFVSYRIVKPFNNLIELFESVSHMDLERLTVSKTYFSEVVKLQKHFLFMVNRIRSYKSFIPAHLISQIENGGMEFPGNEEANGSQQQSEGGNSNNSLTSVGSLKKAGAKSGKKKYIASRTMFSLHLETRQVTMVTILMEGLNEMLNEASVKEVVNLLSDVFQEINAVVKPKGGQLVGTDNDTFTISFNASTDLSKHEEKALAASQLLRDKLSKLKSIKWKNLEYWKKHSSFLDKVIFRTAILCQQSQTGNIGTSDSKTFTIIGSFKYNSDALLEVAQRLELDLVVTERLYTQFSDTYYMRFVDSIDLANDSMYTSPKFKEDNMYVGNVFEVGELSETKADEWMYELEEQGKKEKWKLYNRACDLFFEMSHTEAMELFEEFLHQHNQTASTIDKPAHHLISVCRSHLEEKQD